MYYFYFDVAVLKYTVFPTLKKETMTSEVHSRGKKSDREAPSWGEPAVDVFFKGAREMCFLD